MNSITTEEVERLMRVVSEPLRKQWEVENYGGKSLVELQMARNEAVAYTESSCFKANHMLNWVCVYGGCLMIYTIIFSRLVHKESTPLWCGALIISSIIAAVIVFIVLVRHQIKKLEAAREILADCDKVFKRFQESVHALNPHGIGNTYHDVITAEYAYDRLKSLAIRVIDAQVSFDAACKSKSIDRWNITHLGNFIQKAEETFDKALRVGVEDFSLPFEKRKTYEEAQAEYDERRPVVATH